MSDKVLAPAFMQNRELSWLDFNKRVLDQGADVTVPLLERLNFISIFWSNLQEFFMVRVGSLTDLSLVKKHIVDTKSGMTPTEQLDAIYKRCHELYPYYEATYENLRKLLQDEGIHHLHFDELNAEQLDYLHDYVMDEVVPFLSPQIINSRHPFPHLEGGSLYVVVRLIGAVDDSTVAAAKKDASAKAKAKAADKGDKDKGKGKGKDGKEGKEGKGDKAKNSKNLGAEGVTLGLIPMPRNQERVIQLPGPGLQFVFLEHAIEKYAAEIFSMYKVKHTNIICVTRNADLDATEGTDEENDDYREHMKRILKKRARLAPVRLESERELSPTIKPLLLKRLGLKEHQTFVTSVPLDMSYTWGLGSRLPEKKRAKLSNVPFTPQWPATLDRNRSIMEQVSEHEVLLSYPYESMDAFVQLLREAVADPAVVSIKITLYRLASQSHLAEALIAAAEAGKEVTALFELRARFDESNNIEWSQRFEQAGCHVIYGFRNFKVHSKICSITRMVDGRLTTITQLGTGNYNEKTARLYTDFSFITTDPNIGRDAAEFFRNMQLENASDNYDILWVAPLQIKPFILSHIDEQIERARAGQPNGLFFKTNSVTDKEIIEKIVEASQAGVKTTLLVRGISCIVPGVPGFTDNVRVVSIVGRLLEHSRIYCFGPFEDCKMYLSSADLMTRNMDKRIEIAWPILNDALRDQVIGYLDICLADTAKLRELLPDKSYTPLGYFAQESADGKTELFEAQQYLIDEAQRKRLAAAEENARREANRAPGVAMFAAPSTTEEETEFVSVGGPELDPDAVTSQDAQPVPAAVAGAYMPGEGQAPDVGRNATRGGWRTSEEAADEEWVVYSAPQPAVAPSSSGSTAGAPAGAPAAGASPAAGGATAGAGPAAGGPVFTTAEAAAQAPSANPVPMGAVYTAAESAAPAAESVQAVYEMPDAATPTPTNVIVHIDTPLNGRGKKPNLLVRFLSLFARKR